MSDSDSDDHEPSSVTEDSDNDFDDEAVEEEEDEPVIMSQAEIKRANVQAMLSGSLQVQRKPMIRGLQCQNVAAVLAQPFRAPFAGATAGHSAELARRLAARRRFVPWGSTSNIAHPGRPLGVAAPVGLGLGIPKPAEDVPEELPPGVEPLVLWEGFDAEGKELPPVSVDNMLVKFLRPHQREGVKFMFECVMGLRGFDGNGCILADDMGLGKTLQGITLLWTLLKQGITGDGPIAKRALIVCPTSLVSNWDDECIKWLKGKVRTMPICEANRADVISSMNRFLNYNGHDRAQVMIVSYETFRIHADRFDKPNSVDLIICDEAHRLKNGDTLTNKALGSVPCLRRVMLSGTPMQNHLDEFYSMVNFCNPGLLGTNGEFYKKFEKPILDGREPDATEKQLALAQERNGELSELVNKFVLRRTNTILSKHLPPKVVEVVCCKLSPLQQMIYRHFLSEKAAKTIATGKSAMVLAAITGLKKLCNHPKLIHDMISAAKTTNKGAAGFESCADFFGDGLYDCGSRGLGRERGGGGLPEGWELHSGKFAVLARLLAILRKETKDRVVIISNYTQTLDLIQTLCRNNRYPFCRLDGGTSISKRQKLVKRFNDPAEDCFVFLLSSKAGGCGINLIGGNRLVLFDPDWNPANDKQAAARCWRDGQKKKCYLYRFLATGSIEEKVFQRQLSKESLQNVVNGEGTLEQSSMSKEELRRLFTLDDGTVSDTHDCGGCDKCPSKNFEGLHGSADGQTWEEQDDDAVETDLNTWGHHHRMDQVPDPIMRRAAGDDVSFIFSLQVEGCAVVDKEKPKGDAETKLAAAPPAVNDGPPVGAAGGYRLAAADHGGTRVPKQPPGGPGMAPVGGIRGRPTPGPARRPLAPVAANATDAARAVAAKPNARSAGNPAGVRRAPAPPSKPPAKKARKRKDDSESEMDLDDESEESEEEESEVESEEESEEESGEVESWEESEEEGEGVERGSDDEKPAAAAAAPERRTMRGAAAAAAAILVDPADETRAERRTRYPARRSRREAAALDDEDDDDEEEAASESDEPVADSEDDDDAGAGAKPPGDSPPRRGGGRGDVNRASVNVAGASARAGVEVDAVRDGRRKSEVVASVSPDDFSDSEDELAMVSESDDQSDYSESE